MESRDLPAQIRVRIMSHQGPSGWLLARAVGRVRDMPGRNHGMQPAACDVRSLLPTEQEWRLLGDAEQLSRPALPLCLRRVWWPSERAAAGHRELADDEVIGVLDHVLDHLLG